MQKYKIMLVDDEKIVMDVIRQKINWEEIGMEEPTYAENGLEALEAAEKDKPDIVLTDIKMPYMDGLELSRQLKQLYPDIRIIILSGFDEFEYAKEAVSLNAEEYILKPIDSVQLTQVFMRTVESLNKERDERRNKEMLENYYRDSLPVLRENFFTSLVQGRIPADEYQSYIQNYQLHIPGPYYVIAILHTSSTHVPADMNFMLLSVSVRKLAEEQIDQKWHPSFFTYLSNLCVLFNLEKADDVHELTDEMDRFCRLCLSTLKAVVTCGIGQVCQSFSEISTSYNGARQAVSYRVIYGSSKAINIAEIEPEETEDTNDQAETELRELFKRIKLEDKDRVKEAVHTYLCDSLPHSMISHDLFVMDLSGQLARFARMNQLDINKIFFTDEKSQQEMQNMDPEALEKWMTDVCLKMQKVIHAKRSENTKDFVTKAKNYVKEHYSDPDLSQASLCKDLGVSACYFSTVFKKETNQSFTSYLTDIRLNKAADLLVEGNEKSYIIAHQVGYNDPNYFSYVFRRRFGVSPSKYKHGNE